MPFSVGPKCRRALLKLAGAAVAIASLTVLQVVGAQRASAQLINPNEYVTLPAGTNLFLGYYFFGTLNDFNQKPLGTDKNSHLETNLGVARYVHFFDVGGYTAVLQVYQPFGLESNAKIFGDEPKNAFGAVNTILGATIWPVSNTATKTYLGLSGFLNVPDGTYNENQTQNLGDNRWSGVVQVGGNQGIGTRLSVDLVLDATFYGDNDKFSPIPGIVPANLTLRQQTSYRVQTFLNYNINPAARVSIGFEGQYGGVQSFAGLPTGPLPTGLKTEFDRLRLDGSLFLSPTWQLLAEINHDVRAIGGFKQEFGLTFRVLKIF